MTDKPLEQILNDKLMQLSKQDILLFGPLQEQFNLLWYSEIPHILQQPVRAVGDFLYALTKDKLFIINRHTGSQETCIPLQEVETPGKRLFEITKNIIVTEDNNNVLRFDPVTGTKKRPISKSNLIPTFRGAKQAFVCESATYVTDSKYYWIVYGHEERRGRRRWKYRPEKDKIIHSVSEDDSFSYITSGNLSVLDKTQGFLQWEYPKDDSVFAQRCLGDTVFIVTTKAHFSFRDLVALHRSTGEEKWKNHIPRTWRMGLLGDKLLYTHQHKECLQTYGLADGIEQWKVVIPKSEIKNVRTTDSGISVILYEHKKQNMLAGIDVCTGDILWKDSLAGTHLKVGNNSILFSPAQNKICGIDIKTGESIGHIDLRGNESYARTLAEIVIEKDGSEKAYISRENGRLYAFESKND